jgi:uncharacterized protein YdeI (YjbR/CyaY-like superfamily)
VNEQAQHFGSVDEFAAWLDANHSTAADVWVALPKKGTPVESVTRAEALDVALCYGWIDARANSAMMPDGWWAQRFCPRRPRSTWSKVNVAKVAELIAAGRMRPAGLAQIEAAKADGRWDAAYEPASTATAPADLRAALDAVPAAAAAFAGLRAADRYQILLTLQTIKRADTRARRIARYVGQLAGGSEREP